MFFSCFPFAKSGCFDVSLGTTAILMKSSERLNSRSLFSPSCGTHLSCDCARPSNAESFPGAALFASKGGGCMGLIDMGVVRNPSRVDFLSCLRLQEAIETSKGF